jgi:hypothetical protein
VSNENNSFIRGGWQNNEKSNSDRMQFGDFPAGSTDHGPGGQSLAECQGQA